MQCSISMKSDCVAESARERQMVHVEQKFAVCAKYAVHRHVDGVQAVESDSVYAAGEKELFFAGKRRIGDVAEVVARGNDEWQCTAWWSSSNGSEITAPFLSLMRSDSNGWNSSSRQVEEV